MTVHHFSSADSGAPSLGGTAGSLKNLLKACLVGTAGVAYGSVASAGWDLVWESGNNAAFQSLSEDGNCYPNNPVYQIQDDGTLTGGNNEAHLTMWETNTALNTGTGCVPTNAVAPQACGLRHSGSGVPWDIVCDERTVYIFIGWYSSTQYADGFGFGDFKSILAVDSYGAFVSGRNVYNNSSNPGSLWDNNVGYAVQNIAPTALTTNGTGGYRSSWVLRSYDGNYPACPLGVYVWGPNFTYPNAISGGGWLTPNWVYEFAPANQVSTTTPRGSLRGVYRLDNNFNNTGDAQYQPALPPELAGRTMWRSPAMGNKSPGQVVWLDVTGPW